MGADYPRVPEIYPRHSVVFLCVLCALCASALGVALRLTLTLLRHPHPSQRVQRADSLPYRPLQQMRVDADGEQAKAFVPILPAPRIASGHAGEHLVVLL